MLFYIFPQPISPVVQWLTFCIIIVHLSKLRHWCWHVPVHFLTKLQYLFRFHHLLVAKFSSCLSGLWLFLHLLFFSINFLRSIHQISHTGSSHLRCFYVFLMIRPVFSLFLFNWNMIALQCSVCFCCTTSWISTHKLPPSWASLPPFHSTPLGHDRAQQHSNFLLASYFMHDRVYVSMRLSQFTFLSLLPHPSCPQVHNFASITALEKIGYIFFFSMPTRWGASTLTWYPHEITNNINFYHLVKVRFVRFLHWKIVILPIHYSMFWKQVIKSSLPWSVGSGMGIKFNHT